MSALPRLFLRAMARTGGRAALWSFALLSAGTLAQWLTFIRVPSLHCGLLLVAAVLTSSIALAAEVAMVAGPAAALAELRLDGSWLGLRSLGARGRNLVPPALIWAVGLGGAALFAGHILAPVGRGWLRDAQIEAAVGLRLRSDRATLVGPWALASGPSSAPSGTPGVGLRFAGQLGGATIVGTANTVALTGAKGAVRVVLGDGEVHTDAGGPRGAAPDWALRFSSLETALPVGDGERVQIGERSTPELLRRALDPYETWILWKRSLVPLALAVLAAVGLPLGGRVRAGPGVGVLGVAFWALLRLSDVAAQRGSIPAAAALLVLPCLVATGIGWATWRDR